MSQNTQRILATYFDRFFKIEKMNRIKVNDAAKFLICVHLRVSVAYFLNQKILLASWQLGGSIFLAFTRSIKQVIA